MRQSYPSDLMDAQWQILEPLLPTHKCGRPRIVDIREVINAILYVLCTGCGWEYLPHDFPHCKTTYYYFARWRDDGTWTTIHERLRGWARAVDEDRPRHRVWRWPIVSQPPQPRWCQSRWAMAGARR